MRDAGAWGVFEEAARGVMERRSDEEVTDSGRRRVCSL